MIDNGNTGEEFQDKQMQNPPPTIPPKRLETGNVPLLMAVAWSLARA